MPPPRNSASIVVVLCAVALAAAAAPSQAQAREILTRLPSESEVDSWGGVTAVSVLQRGGGAYRLAVVRGAGRRLLRDVPASPVPFDVDVGPDSTGAPALVYPRCRGGGGNRELPLSCDLAIHWLDARGERPISTANGRGREGSPSLWRGRIAWAVGERLLTRSRLSSRTMPATSIPTGRRAMVTDVELRTPRLALQLGYTDPDGFNTDELRVTLSGGGAATLVARLSGGEGGQRFLGLSLTREHVGWQASCFGDPGGCGEVGGAYRYRVVERRTERAAETGQLSGFALLGQAAALGIYGGRELGDDPEDYLEEGIELSGLCDDPRTDRTERGCPLVRLDPPEWRGSRRGRR